MTKSILICCFCIILCSCNEEWCVLYPIPGPPSGEQKFGGYDMGFEYAPGDVPKGESSIRPCVYVRSVPVSDVTMTVSLPPEVQLIEGDLAWKGDLSPDTKKCSTIRFLAKKNWKEWSRPIHFHVELSYEGKRAIGDSTWSYSDFIKNRNTTVWQKQGEEKK